MTNQDRWALVTVSLISHIDRSMFLTVPWESTSSHSVNRLVKVSWRPKSPGKIYELN